jgi:hypothetical protein
MLMIFWLLQRPFNPRKNCIETKDFVNQWTDEIENH